MTNKGIHIKNSLARQSMLTLLFVLPVLIFLFIFFLPALPSSPMLREAFWANKVSNKGKYDIVYIGDSRIYRGIDPAVVEKVTGLNGFNFGFSSASPDSLLISFGLKLLDNDGPRIIVIGVSTNSFLSASTENQHLKMVENQSDKELWIKTHLYPSLTGFDNRSLSDLYKYYKGEAYFESYNIASGFAASSKVPADSTSALNAYIKQFQAEKYDYLKEKAFKSYVLDLKSKGYQVILVRMPSTLAMLELEDEATNFTTPKLLEDMSCKGILVFSSSQSNTLKSYDGSHLERNSAEAFSRQLGKFILELDSLNN